MKSIVMAIMAVAVAVTFCAPASAGEEKKEKKDEIWGHILIWEPGEEKKDEK